MTITVLAHDSRNGEFLLKHEVRTRTLEERTMIPAASRMRLVFYPLKHGTSGLNVLRHDPSDGPFHLSPPGERIELSSMNGLKGRTTFRKAKESVLKCSGYERCGCGGSFSIDGAYVPRLLGQKRM